MTPGTKGLIIYTKIFYHRYSTYTVLNSLCSSFQNQSHLARRGIQNQVKHLWCGFFRVRKKLSAAIFAFIDRFLYTLLEYCNVLQKQRNIIKYIKIIFSVKIVNSYKPLTIFARNSMSLLEIVLNMNQKTS